MDPVCLALLSPSGAVMNVIEVPPGSGPEYATDVLQQPGVWVLDSHATAGVGAEYYADYDVFVSPDDLLGSPAE